METTDYSGVSLSGPSKTLLLKLTEELLSKRSQSVSAAASTMHRVTDMLESQNSESVKSFRLVSQSRLD
jgi:hypothetical protein